MSQTIFFILVVATAFQRLLEVRLSTKNEKRILEAGGREHSPGHFKAMKALHIMWIISMPLEVYIFNRPFFLWLFIPALFLTLMGQSFRLLAIKTLGERWTVRIMTRSDLPLVNRGIYQYVRHPNYVGVVVEIMAMPLMHTAYLTSIFFSIANAILLFVRIGEEEKALDRAAQI